MAQPSTAQASIALDETLQPRHAQRYFKNAEDERMEQERRGSALCCCRTTCALCVARPTPIRFMPLAPDVQTQKRRHRSMQPPWRSTATGRSRRTGPRRRPRRRRIDFLSIRFCPSEPQRLKLRCRSSVMSQHGRSPRERHPLEAAAGLWLGPFRVAAVLFPVS